MGNVPPSVPQHFLADTWLGTEEVHRAIEDLCREEEPFDPLSKLPEGCRR